MTSAELATPIQTPLMMPMSSGAPKLRHTWRYLPAIASPAIWQASTSGNDAAK